MKTRLLYLLFLGLSVAVIDIHAQPNLGFRTFTYTTENGLPSNGIKGLQWDESSGFLWVATEAGLSRFNGIEFMNYTRGNSSFISSERLRFMVRNRDEQIRAADMNGNILTISENRPELLYDQSQQRTGWENRLVGAAISDSFFEVGPIPNANRIAFPFSQIIPLSPLSALLINPGGVMVKLDMKKRVVEPINRLGRNNLLGFSVDKKIYIQKRAEPVLYQYDEEGDVLTPVSGQLPGIDVKIFWESGMKFPIAIRGKSAWLVRSGPKGLVFDLFCTDIPNLGLIKYVQYSEEKGLLFLGTISKGFAVVRTNRVTQIKKPNASPTDIGAYYSQWEWQEGSIFTNEGHVLGNNSNARAPINGKVGYSIHEDGDSLVWFSSGRKNNTGSFLHRLNKKTGEHIVFEKIQIFNVFAFGRWKDRVLIGCHRGVGVVEGDSLRILFKSSIDNSSDATANSLLKIDDGVFTMTTCAGWIRFDLNTNRSDTLLRLPGYCIRSQIRLGEYVFIGTYGKGIYVYHKGVLKVLPLDKNGFLQYTHCFVPDANGFVWMSTNRGLFKASVADMIQAFERGSGGVYYHYYGRNDGMDLTEMNGGCSPCAIILKDSTISFPTMDGLLWVNPRSAPPLLPDGPIYIDEIRINDRAVDESGFSEHHLSHSENNLLVQLAFSSWCNPENVYLEYQLNDSTRWSRVSEGSIIRLSNLSSGNYQLRIRKRNGFGEDNFSYKTLSFTIALAWYNHPLTYFAGLILLLLTIQQFSRYQNRKLLKKQTVLEQLVGEKTRDLQEQNDLLEKNNQIKNRLISIISHDIVTPLKFLTVAGRGLKEKKDQLSEEEQLEAIGEITLTAQELQLLSTNILNWIKYQSENRRLLPENFNPHELTAQVFSVLGSMAKERGLVLKNLIDPNLKLYQYTEPMKILIYNLISNSVRYSDSGIIDVTIKKQGPEDFVLIVRDNGIGMSEGKVRNILNDEFQVRETSAEKRSGHGLGYLIIKDLVRWMNARLEIESNMGVGTEVRVIFQSSSIIPSEMV